MMTEAASTSETLVNFYQTARRYNPEDSHLHTEKLSELSSCEGHAPEIINTMLLLLLQLLLLLLPLI
jgi:hypothetical protein